MKVSGAEGIQQWVAGSNSEKVCVEKDSWGGTTLSHRTAQPERSHDVGLPQQHCVVVST